MRSKLASVLRCVADELSEPEIPPMPTGLHWTDDNARREQRSRAAIMLLDDETLAGLVVLVRDMGTHAEVLLRGEVAKEFWPAVAQTLADVEREARVAPR
jgi:hypothetical protein